jgi:crotonobetaine/carnitine-CoA ligase
VASISIGRMECVEIVLAAAAIGAIWVPLGPYLKGGFLNHQLRMCEPDILIADQAGAQACVSYLDATKPRLLGLDPQVSADSRQSIYIDGELDAVDGGRATAAVLFTSGTTGPAKGCMVSQGYFAKSAACYSRSLEVADSDSIYSAFPSSMARAW